MARQYAGVEVREAIADEASGLRKQLENPLVAAEMARPQIVKAEVERMEKQVETLTPPKFDSPDHRAAAEARLKNLQAAYNNGNAQMRIPRRCTDHEMEQNPHGALPNHLSHEEFWRGKNLDGSNNVVDAPKGYNIEDEMMDLQQRLAYDAGVDQPGVASLESFRPLGRMPPLAERNPGADPFFFGMSQKGAANLEAADFYDPPTRSEAIKLKEAEHKAKLLEQENRELRQQLETVGGPITCPVKTRSGAQCKGRPNPATGLCAIHSHKAKQRGEV